MPWRPFFWCMNQGGTRSSKYTQLFILELKSLLLGFQFMLQWRSAGRDWFDFRIFFRLGMLLVVLWRLPAQRCEHSLDIWMALLCILVHVPGMQPLFCKWRGSLPEDFPKVFVLFYHTNVSKASFQLPPFLSKAAVSVGAPGFSRTCRSHLSDGSFHECAASCHG